VQSACIHVSAMPAEQQAMRNRTFDACLTPLAARLWNLFCDEEHEQYQHPWTMVGLQQYP